MGSIMSEAGGTVWFLEVGDRAGLAGRVSLLVVVLAVLHLVVVAVVGIVVNVVAAADEVGGGDFENVKVFG